jgi:DNA-3-methyladenine glycosylase
VLFRAFEPVAGIEEMAAARAITIAKESELRKISSGPGRMCEALGVTRDRDNGKALTSAKSDLYLAEDEYRTGRILVTPRIGITKSAEERLRYLVAGNRFVSGGNS